MSVSLILFTFIILLLIASMVYMQGYNIPGPLRVPVIGNFRLCVTKPSKFINLTHYYKIKYGDAYLMYMFNSPTLFLSHPKYVSHLLSSNELVYKGQPYNVIKNWLGEGLLTSLGPKWKTFRKLLTPAFHYNILKTIIIVFLKNDKTFIEILKKHADGNSFDIFPLVALLSLDNVTESIMGVSVDAQIQSDSKYVKAIKELTRILAYRIQNPIARNDVLFNFFPAKKQHDAALEFLHGTTRKVISERRKKLAENNISDLGPGSEFGLTNKHAFLDLLLLTEVNGSKLDNETIREQVDTFMFEGHDTTTSGISFILYCLSKHEDVQEKILNEQKQFLPNELDRDLEFSDLNEMKYLEMVIKESMRIYPPVPFIERTMLDDVEIAGFQVKKDTSIMINILELQRNPEIFENPLAFRPERFDISNIHAKNIYYWVPFSAGPRNCIGQKFAMMEMKLTIASVVKHFKILPAGKEPELCAELVLRSANGVQIRLEKR